MNSWKAVWDGYGISVKRHLLTTRAILLFAAFTVAILAAVGCKDSSGHADGGKPGAGPVVLTEANFQAEVLSSSQPVLVDFWATWCGPCKVIAPVVAEIATEYQGRAKVAKLEVDTAPALAQKYGVQAIPTLMFFKDGKVIDQSLGVVSKRELQGKLEKLLPATPPTSAPVAGNPAGQ
jgi:thioredoxin 1